MDLRGEIERVFGHSLFDRPLFYCYPDGLRFELAEGDTALQQFLSAHRKALLIAQDAFRGSDHFAVCLRDRMHEGGGLECRQLVRELKAAQIPLPAVRAFWADAVDPDDWADEEEPQVDLTLAFAAPIALLSNVLWCALAKDLGISPKLQCSVYLLNLQAGVALFPYDDRGMDVVGPNRSTLQQLYAQHRSLLLPYDLPQMQSTFGAL
jgi:hypothetical protein